MSKPISTLGFDDFRQAVSELHGFQAEPRSIIEDFIEQHCKLNADKRTPARDMYAAYVSWAEERNVTPLTSNAFGRQLTASGLQPELRGGVAYYEGVEILTRPAATPTAPQWEEFLRDIFAEHRHEMRQMLSEFFAKP